MNEYIYNTLGRIATGIEERTGRPYYKDSSKHNEQFVGRIPLTVGEFEARLKRHGFSRVSYGSERSWTRPIDEDQLHVVFYSGESIETGDSGFTYVYAHVEIKPNVAPLSHIRNDSVNGPIGVRKMKKLFDETGIPHEPIRP